jgi:transposase
MSRTRRAARPTSDARWLVHLLECGLLAGSFIPPAETKAARDVIRAQPLA